MRKMFHCVTFFVFATKSSWAYFKLIFDSSQSNDYRTWPFNSWKRGKIFHWSNSLVNIDRNNLFSIFANISSICICLRFLLSTLLYQRFNSRQENCRISQVMTRGLKDDLFSFKKWREREQNIRDKRKKIVNLCYKNTYGQNWKTITFRMNLSNSSPECTFQSKNHNQWGYWWGTSSCSNRIRLLRQLPPKQSHRIAGELTGLKI